MKSKIAANLLPILGTLIFLFLVLPLFLILIPYIILSFPNFFSEINSGIFRYLGVVPISLGVAIYLWCSHNFVFFGKGTPLHFTPVNRLIVIGLYRYVRNPMYIGALFIIAGQALFFQSTGLILYTFLSFGVIHFFVLLLEEPHLSRTYGDTYQRYRQHVHRWIPRLTPYRENGSDIDSTRNDMDGSDVPKTNFCQKLGLFYRIGKI